MLCLPELQGITAKSDVGFLTLLEHLRYCEVKMALFLRHLTALAAVCYWSSFARILFLSDVNACIYCDCVFHILIVLGLVLCVCVM